MLLVRDQVLEGMCQLDIMLLMGNLVGLTVGYAYGIGSYIRSRVLQIPRSLASQSIPSWNQIILWLKEMETLRNATAPHIVANIAIAAAAIITAVAHPSHLSSQGLTRLPITFLLLVKSTTMTINGGARTPFNTAARNNIFTA